VGNAEQSTARKYAAAQAALLSSALTYKTPETRSAAMTSEAILQEQLDECRKELEKERSRSEKLVKKLQESHLRHGQLVRRPQHDYFGAPRAPSRRV